MTYLQQNAKHTGKREMKAPKDLGLRHAVDEAWHYTDTLFVSKTDGENVERETTWSNRIWGAGSDSKHK